MTRPGSWHSEQPLSRTADDRPVVINVGGIRFYVSWSLIDRLPQTRLGRLRRARNTQDILDLCDKFNIEDNEYYFDRHPRNFGREVLEAYVPPSLKSQKHLRIRSLGR